jgi:hypothetical protein
VTPDGPFGEGVPSADLDRANVLLRHAPADDGGAELEAGRTAADVVGDPTVTLLRVEVGDGRAVVDLAALYVVPVAYWIRSVTVVFPASTWARMPRLRTAASGSVR